MRLWPVARWSLGPSSERRQPYNAAEIVEHGPRRRYFAARADESLRARNERRQPSNAAKSRPETVPRRHVLLQREKLAIDQRKREEEAIAQALDAARVAARIYCKSEEGNERFHVRAIRRARIEMDARRKDKWTQDRDAALQKQEGKIDARHYDREKKLRKRRDEREAELYKRLREELEPQEDALEGYAQEKVKAEIRELLRTLQDMPEDKELRANERSRQKALTDARKVASSKSWQPAGKFGRFLQNYGDRQQKELAEELAVDLIKRYTAKQLEKAEADIRDEHEKMRKISSAWQGLGALEVLRAWHKWAKAQGRRRDRDHWHSQRDKLRWSADCVAALELAHWTLSKFEPCVEEWSDTPYWRHVETGAVVWEEPTIENLLPPDMQKKFPPELDARDPRSWERVLEEQAMAQRLAGDVNDDDASSHAASLDFSEDSDITRDEEADSAFASGDESTQGGPKTHRTADSDSDNEHKRRLVRKLGRFCRFGVGPFRGRLTGGVRRPRFNENRFGSSSTRRTAGSSRMSNPRSTLAPLSRRSVAASTLPCRHET